MLALGRLHQPGAKPPFAPRYIVKIRDSVNHELNHVSTLLSHSFRGAGAGTWQASTQLSAGQSGSGWWGSASFQGLYNFDLALDTGLGEGNTGREDFLGGERMAHVCLGGPSMGDNSPKETSPNCQTDPLCFLRLAAPERPHAPCGWSVGGRACLSWDSLVVCLAGCSKVSGLKIPVYCKNRGTTIPKGGPSHWTQRMATVLTIFQLRNVK